MSVSVCYEVKGPDLCIYYFFQHLFIPAIILAFIFSFIYLFIPVFFDTNAMFCPIGKLLLIF